MRIRALIATMLALGGAPVLPGAPALAQESASHKLEEQVVNAGGHPADGVSPSSASHRLTLGALGDPLSLTTLSGPTTMLSGGFGAPYPPPGEVMGLMFTDATSLVWLSEHSAGSYNLYRDDVGALGGLGYGDCVQQDLASPATTDTDAVPLGGAFFYFITVENRLGDEGIKGFDSSGALRAGTVCP